MSRRTTHDDYLVDNRFKNRAPARCSTEGCGNAWSAIRFTSAGMVRLCGACWRTAYGNARSTVAAPPQINDGLWAARGKDEHDRIEQAIQRTRDRDAASR